MERTSVNLTLVYFYSSTPGPTCESTDIADVEQHVHGSTSLLLPHHYILARKLTNALNVIVSLVGIVTNIINLITFFKMGLRDSVTLTFFCLALYDFSFILPTAVVAVSQITILVQQDLRKVLDFSPIIIYLIGGNLGLGICQGSMIVTTYLAVQRCCCVALPFFFRDLFTFKRTLFVMIAFGLYTLCVTGAFLSTYTVETRLDPTVNRTRFFLKATAHREKTGPILSTLDSVIALVAQVIMTICVVIMTVRLRRSMEFKQKASRANTDKDISENDFYETNKSSSVPTSKPPKTNELQVIKSVALICTLFIFCSTPRHVHLAFKLIVADYDTFGRYSKMYFLVVDILMFLGVLNSSTNFFVYVSVNTKFKDTMSSYFCNTSPRSLSY